MSNFKRRVERDLREISEHAPSSTDAWTAIRSRVERDGTDEILETIMLGTEAHSPTRRRLLPIVAGAAVLILVALVVALYAVDDSEVDTVDDPTGEFPVSEVDGLSALVVDGNYFQMTQAACVLGETVTRGGTELVKVVSEGRSADGQRYSANLTRTLGGEEPDIDKVRLVWLGDATVDGKLAELQYTAEGEALFEVNGDLVQAADLEATSPDGSESITASFTFDC